MRKIKFRIILPLIFGLTAIGLIAWDYHNMRIIESMGMDWDTCAPIWPYQTSWMLLFAINAPAIFLSRPLCFLLDLKLHNSFYPIHFLAILLFWYWVGSRLDWGLLGVKTFRHPKRWAVLLIVSAIALLAYFSWDTWKSLSLWIILIDTRLLFPIIFPCSQ